MLAVLDVPEQARGDDRPCQLGLHSLPTDHQSADPELELKSLFGRRLEDGINAIVVAGAKMQEGE